MGRPEVARLRRTGAALAACALAVVLLGATAAGAAPARSKFRVTSPAFVAGGDIPDGFTCDGANELPPLRWRGVPRGAVELALVMEDPDAPSGTFVHWVVWGIDPAARALPEQVVPAGAREGANGTGGTGYLGPCPPPGGGSHRYRFTLSAVDAPLTIAVGASATDLRAAIRGHILATARLVGRYERAAG